MSKLTALHYIKNLKLIRRNKEWLQVNGVRRGDKFSYYGSIVLSYVMRKKKIKYLGSTLYYDNIATPLILQSYPYEVYTSVIANMHKHPKTVLDIGGNLGQFTLTINYILKGKTLIDVFEPNRYAYKLLMKNVEFKKNITLFNYGLGDSDTKEVLHFNPNRTSIGSVLEQNAGEDASISQEISITSSPQILTKRKKYDLVKVDVEGYEFHAIKGLAGISCKYLFMEFSGLTREKDYMHSEMMTLMEKQWGEYDICYCSGLGSEDDIFDMLIRFK